MDTPTWLTKPLTDSGALGIAAGRSREVAVPFDGSAGGIRAAGCVLWLWESGTASLDGSGSQISCLPSPGSV